MCHVIWWRGHPPGNASLRLSDASLRHYECTLRPEQRSPVFRLGFVPRQLLAALEDDQQQLDRLLSGMEPQALPNSAWACGLLGYSSSRLPGAFLQQAASRLQQQQTLNPHSDSSNVCWAAAVLDLQQCVPDMLQLVRAASQQWESLQAEDMRQLFQVHLWLLDCGLPAGQPGLSQCLSAQQLQQCRASWQQALNDATAVAKASQLQRSVFIVLKQLPTSTWQQAPAMEQRTADGVFSIDIAAVTAAGQQLALEVDGPSHFVRPGRAVNGPTQSRNRALAARGYAVVSVPY